MNIKQYMLAIKRNNNDYLPLEWNCLDNYEGENLTTLEGIDKYTAKQGRIDLLSKVVSDNLISIDELFQDFVIIYKEKGRNRELKEGTIFEDKKEYLDFSSTTKFITDNINNKDLLNQICNICLNKDNNQQLFEFIYIIKNIDLLYNKNLDIHKVISIKFNNLNYFYKRRISYWINTKFIKKDKNNVLIKEIA